MGFFGTTGGHTDDGDDEAGLTCMISNSRLPDDYEAGRFHIFGTGMYVLVNPKTASIFSGLGKHGGTPPIAPDGVELSVDSNHLMIVFYSPRAILSPDGISIPFGSLPNGTLLTLGPEITSPLLVIFLFIVLVIMNLHAFQYSGARESTMTTHSCWAHDGLTVMEKTSHLNLMSMGLLQFSSYLSEQMPMEVTIDINKFLGAFSTVADGRRIQPPSWHQSENGSVTIRPSGPIALTSLSESSTPSPAIFNMDDYRRSRQSEALRWIDLQEKRASIIARLQPRLAEDYQKLRTAVTSEAGPLRRTSKKQTSTKVFSSLICNLYILI